jgi:TRAP-type C4-dicarboxylate transport system permease small subunit
MSRHPALSRAARGIARVEHALVSVAALAVFAIMLIVAVDVVLRYLFNAPLAWSYELISSYLMPASFFFGVSETLRREQHVNVDIVYARFPLRLRRVCKMLGWAATGIVFALITWLAARGAWSRYVTGDVMAGAIPWPTWIPAALGAIGMAVMTLRLALGAIALLLASAKKDAIDPGLAGSDVAGPTTQPGPTAVEPI